jgi:hypothetical protein
MVAQPLYLTSGNDTVDDNEYEYSDATWNAGFIVYGFAGHDSIYTYGGDDILYGGDGDDILNAGDGINELFGGDGNDTLVAFSINNTMTGGEGSDRYVLDYDYFSSSNIPTIIETGVTGTDKIEIYSHQGGLTFNLSWVTGIENLEIEISVNLTNTTLIGNDSNNVIQDNGNWDGTRLEYRFVLDNSFYGMGGNDTIYGYAGNDYLDGGSGNDTLIGGWGNDHYVIDSASDIVTELANEGTDLIESSITITSLATNVENLMLTGSSAINGTGNELDNDITLLATFGNNVIDGNAGNDYVVFWAGKSSVITSFGFHHNNTSAIVIEGAWGTDTIVDCEYISFSDGDFSVADLKAEYASNYNPLFFNVTSGEAPFMMADTYTGTVSGIQWQYLAQLGLHANTVGGSTGNDFIKWDNPYNSMIGTLGNPNFASALLAVLLVILVAQITNKRISVFYKLIAIVAAIMSIVCIFLSDSRQGLLTFGTGFLFYISLTIYYKNKKVGLSLILTSTILLILSIFGMLQKGPLA